MRELVQPSPVQRSREREKRSGLFRRMAPRTEERHGMNSTDGWGASGGIQRAGGDSEPLVTLAPDQPPRELREERLDAVYDRQTELKGRIQPWWSATWVHSSTRRNVRRRDPRRVRLRSRKAWRPSRSPCRGRSGRELVDEIVAEVWAMGPSRTSA